MATHGDEHESEQPRAATSALSAPRANGLSRRQLLRASAAVGGVGATAGCLDRVGLGGRDSGAKSTVFVFNTADKTVSLIDATTRDLITRRISARPPRFPSNQYAPRTTDTAANALWLNVGNGVQAVDAVSLKPRAHIPTGSGSNWLEHTPPSAAKKRVVVSAREPAHKQVRIDADPHSKRFGEVTGTIPRKKGYDGPRGGPGPCDIMFAPDGTHAFVLDVFASTLTVLDVDAFEVVAQVDVEPVVEGVENAHSWMGTASWDGTYLVTENNEGQHGTESIWDVSDPTNPTELKRLRKADGLGKTPLTNEIGPNSKISYVFTPGSNDVTVVDLERRAVKKRIDLGGKAYVGTWDPERRYLYVPVQTQNTVTIIDHEKLAVTETISVGAKPYGATAAQVRPQVTMTGETKAALASVGALSGGGTTHCIGECHC
jgi:YVTN family beta-propeller protein